MSEFIRRYLFPQHWRSVKLCHLFERVSTRCSRADVTVLTISAEAGLIPQSEFFNRRVASSNLSTYYYLQRGDFAYNKSYSIGYPFGAVARLDKYDDGVVSPLYICFRLASGECDSDFVLHCFEAGVLDHGLHMISKEGARAHGLLNVGVGEFFDIDIAIPCLPEQHKIARILTTLDELIEKTEALIAKYQVIKQGMMHDLFTRGVDQHGQLRPPQAEAPELYKQSDLGWIPREWEIRRIVDIAEVKGGKRLPAGEPFADGPTPFPYIRVSDMADGSVDPRNIEYVPRHIEPLIRAYKIAKDDLYISIAGVYLGIVGTVPDRLHNAQLTENAAKIVFRDKEAQSKEYVSFFFNSPLFAPQLWTAQGIGAGVPKLPLYQIERFVVPLPSRDEQWQVVSRVKVLRDKISDEMRFLEKVNVLKSGLMQDLLTGKVRVKVDDATEDTADA